MAYPTLRTLKIKPKNTAAAAAPPATGLAGALASVAPIDTAGILDTARKQAGLDVGANVAGIRAIQDQDVNQATRRAGYVSDASKAAARFLSGLGLGKKLATGYREAGNDIAALGAGYSGQLQHDVGTADAQLAGNLTKLGAPGGAPSGAAAAGNVVYGIGGKLPAEGLLAAAPTAVANENAATRALVGYGQQQGLGMIGAGQQAAQRLEPNIVAAEAKLPSLITSYTTSLTNAAEKSRQNAITDVFKAAALDQAGNRDAALAEYRKAEVDAATARIKEQAAHNSAMEGIAQQNADTSYYSATHPSAKVVGSDKRGYGILNADGSITPLPGKYGKPTGGGAGSGGKGALTQNEIGGLVDGWALPQTESQTVEVVGQDGKPKLDANGKPVTETKTATIRAPFTFSEAITGLVGRGVARPKAVAAVLSNPTFADEAQTALNGAVQTYAQHGTSIKTAAREIQQASGLPASLVVPALKAAYAREETLRNQARGLGLQGVVSGPNPKITKRATTREPAGVIPVPAPPSFVNTTRPAWAS